MELLLDERLVEELPEVRKFDDELLDDELEERLEELPEVRKFDDELFDELVEELDTVPLLDDEELLKLLLLVVLPLFVVLRPEVVALRKPELDVPPFTRLWFIPDDVAPLFLMVELTLLPFILLP